MDKERIMSKIAAMMERTVENGCTEAEAIEAAKMVQKLLSKHKLTIADLPADADEREEIALSSQCVKRQWEIWLWNVVAGSMACKIHSESGEGRTCMVFMGRQTDILAVEKLAGELTAIIRVNARKQKRLARAKYGSDRGIEKAYANGFIVEVARVMGEQSRALVLVPDEEVVEKYEDAYPDLKTVKLNKPYYVVDMTAAEEASAKGRSDGRDKMAVKRLRG